MTRLDAIRGHLETMKREHDSMAALYRKDVAWLVETVDRLKNQLEGMFKITDDGKNWCEFCGCEWGKCHSAGSCFCNKLARLEEPDA